MNCFHFRAELTRSVVNRPSLCQIVEGDCCLTAKEKKIYTLGCMQIFQIAGVYIGVMPVDETIA